MSYKLGYRFFFFVELITDETVADVPVFVTLVSVTLAPPLVVGMLRSRVSHTPHKVPSLNDFFMFH